MNNSNTSQPLAQFGITALHGERNIKITFDGPVKILVAENGYGKTTILNTLYALIFGNYEKLRLISFKTLSLKFKSGNEIILDKDDFAIAFDNAPPSGMLQHFKTMLTIEHLQNLYEDFITLRRPQVRSSAHFPSAWQEVQKRYQGMQDETLIQWLEVLSTEMRSTSLYSPKLQDARKIIQDEFPFEAIYLPTYRRIEEDFVNLTGITGGLPVDKNVIRFGMTDVQDNIDQITSEIKNSSIQWFAKVNGQMLGQLIKGIQVTEEMKASLGDKEALRIVLERIGDNMPLQDKTQILQLIETGEIFQPDHESLAYFLANLVKVYEQQKINDNAIKQFTERSNKYLVNKRVVYDESAVDISIKRKKNDQPVDINTLSSGEKQIISLFSRLFLSKSKQVAIFFDEPELSLSIEWQKHLLPDIIDSGICSFLFCTTHSPFIFDNDLARYTSGLDQYIEEL